ncbi:unnamed protein product [Nezara viridula]|uniref:Uncharacterized protein n=1 Tax=Nezara viridula TaxID=85310 RepID=A0A9P0E8F3_NEZVI|nr:unnamed protein product [Nezara viridula]
MPKTRWIDTINKDTAELLAANWKALAQNRQRWRRDFCIFHQMTSRRLKELERAEAADEGMTRAMRS